MASDEWVSASAPYVAPRSKGAPDAWTEESAAHGRKGGQELTFAGEVAAPEAVVLALGIGDDEHAIARKRVITLDGQPIELTDTYYPAAIAAGTPLAEPLKIRGGAITLLAELGYTAATVHEDVTARAPTEAERRQLRLDVTDPVLILTRTSVSSAGEPIQVDLITMPATDRHLHYELKVK